MSLQLVTEVTCHFGKLAVCSEVTEGYHAIFDSLRTFAILTNEPPHDKSNKVAVRPAKTQISLGIRPVCSESSLCAQWVAKDPSFLHADSEDSDQTGRTCHFVGFVTRRLKYM